MFFCLFWYCLLCYFIFFVKNRLLLWLINLIFFLILKFILKSKFLIWIRNSLRFVRLFWWKGKRKFSSLIFLIIEWSWRFFLILILIVKYGLINIKWIVFLRGVNWGKLFIRLLERIWKYGCCVYNMNRERFLIFILKIVWIVLLLMFVRIYIFSLAKDIG